MAEEKKKGYPKIPRGNWFLLREKFKQRAPERVSPSYIASALAMTEASAKANIIPPLRAFGLIDETGKPTDLAYDWRDDSKYPAVCKQIVDETYPQELRDLYHQADAPAKNVISWFARSAKVGEAAARGYATTYLMLLEADLGRAKENGSAKAKSNAKQQTRPPKPTAHSKTEKPQPTAKAKVIQHHQDDLGHERDSQAPTRGFHPKLHVDIQIHISPDSSPEQIEKIFESMAKHLPLAN